MVNIKKVLEEKNLSINICAKMHKIPYASLYGLVHKTADISNCSYETAKTVAQIVGIPMEYLNIPDIPFQEFRSNLHHALKRDGELKIRQDIVSWNLVEAYRINEQEIKSLYLLRLLEYIESQQV